MRDYDAIVLAPVATAARRAYSAFLRKRTPRSAAFMRSLKEAGDDLLIYYRFPRSQWKRLRTTNTLERLNASSTPRP